jgi:hypothetical protein
MQHNLARKAQHNLARKVQLILARNMTIPPEGAPCYAKIMELKDNVDYLESFTDGPNFGEQLKYLDRLKTYCHLLNLPEGNAMEEYEMLLQQKPFLEGVIREHYVAKRLPPYGSAAYKEHETKGNRLQQIEGAMKRQLPFYAEFLSTPPNEIAALWGSSKPLENRIRNLGLSSVPMRSSKTLYVSPEKKSVLWGSPKTLENHMINLGLPSVPMRNTSNFPSPYKGPIRPPFKKGGKRTKKARKYRRRTSRS